MVAAPMAVAIKVVAIRQHHAASRVAIPALPFQAAASA
jgi:hypothetical protein